MIEQNPQSQSEVQKAALEALEGIINEAGHNYGFEFASIKSIPGKPEVEIGVKPAPLSLLTKWHFVRVNVVDRTIGEIAHAAALEFALWAGQQVKPADVKAH